ncbi:MAG TPA: hypothetical protein VG711_10985, partial [Phycisphaerales bacterium]|nr:hypothetical protein [Phycisphaerales bacterium]
YTLEEVSAKLKKSPDEVKQMVKSGQIQEFRDRDKLMYKVEQIDLLAGDDDGGEVHLDLADTSGGSSIGMTGSGLDLKDDSAIGLVDSREGTGISVFDTDHGSSHGSSHGSAFGSSVGDVAGETRVGETVDEELSLEAVGSGSGLLDLTKESDETSLGAELLEEVYTSPEKVEMPANASGLFEAATDRSEEPMMAGGGVDMPMVMETYDGAGSGLGAGLMIGALVSLICSIIICVVGASGATPKLATMFADNLWMWVGMLLGVTLVLGAVGFFVGKASE